MVDSTDVKRAAAQAGDSDAIEALARVGYAVNGLMHLLIGWIALQLAFGGRGQSADQSGAFGHLASNGLGKALLWLSVAGFVGLAIWQVAEALSGRGETADRVKAGAKAIAYAAMGYTAFTFANGGKTSSGKQTSDITASLMSSGPGTALLWLVGLGIAAIGVYHVHKGWKKKFLSDLERHPGEAVEKAGQVGYIAKGIALMVVGWLFVSAILKHDAKASTGLDGALRELLDAPFGQWLLAATAVGFVLFGLYCFARARHARV